MQTFQKKHDTGDRERISRPEIRILVFTVEGVRLKGNIIYNSDRKGVRPRPRENVLVNGVIHEIKDVCWMSKSEVHLTV